jgi:patatin-like phospholipase/acyl hydrolase
MLSVDGGGVKGVIPLMYLQHLDEALASFGCAVRDYFDFVCGTSAGKKKSVLKSGVLIYHRRSCRYWDVPLTVGCN